MYNAKQVADKLNLHNKVVRNRATKIGLVKRSVHWSFTDSDIEKIKNYETPPVFRSAYYFSNDGEYLILNSRMNQFDCDINKLKVKS